MFYLLTQNTFTTMNNDVLVAVPLFLLMGYMVERSNLLDKLFHSVQLALKRVPGSLAVATLVTCALFATATGIVGAVVTLMGLLAFPQMLKAGYDVRVASGVVCAGGCLGILIPPSIMLIVYAAMAGMSVVQLYAAALVPGLPARRDVLRLRHGPGDRSSRTSCRRCPRSRATCRCAR